MQNYMKYIKINNYQKNHKITKRLNFQILDFCILTNYIDLLCIYLLNEQNIPSEFYKD